MSIPKRTLVAGAAIAAVGMASVGSIGLVSAAANTSSSDTTGTSIVDKIASKFNLNKSDVQAVFDQDRSDHRADMQQQQQERIAQAVKDGKLTQAQADHITQALKEIQDLMGTAGPDQQSDDARTQVKSKMDELRTWAKDNNVDMQYVGMMHGGHGGFGGPGDMHGQSKSGSNNDTKSSTDSSTDSSSTN